MSGLIRRRGENLRVKFVGCNIYDNNSHEIFRDIFRQFFLSVVNTISEYYQ